MNKSGLMKKFTLIMFFAISLIIIVSPSSGAAERKTSTAEELKVEIISLKEGERVHGNIAIEAHINHPELVKYCEFYIQEPGAKDRYSWKDYSSPYFWGGDGQTLDTTLFDDGVASVVVFCFPKNSQPAMFQQRVYFIIDNGKPRLKIISPQDQDSIQGSVVIRADASDLRGIRQAAGIGAVYLYIDGGLIEKIEKYPFQTTLRTCLLRPGFHSLMVVAEDTEGLTSADNIIIYVHSRKD